MSNALYFIIIFSSWVFCLTLTETEKARNLNRLDFQNITHYEAVNYNVEDVHNQHLKATKTSKRLRVSIRFSAFQRNFRLSLEQHKRLFSENAEFHVLSTESNQSTRYDPRTFYTGTIEGDPASLVMGHILEGQFDGSFFTFGETFHLEPSGRYFSSPTSFHSIVFPASDVEFDFDQIRRTAVHFKDQKQWIHQAVFDRQRRSSFTNSSLNTCAVHVAADHLFLRSVGGGSESATIAEMVYHVGMADKLFRATDFNQDGRAGDDVGFVIAAVTVFQDENGEGSSSPENNDIMTYLLKWSEVDHNSYCLAMLFTYRDFSEGALGLAWVAEPDHETPGGICSKRVLLENENKAVNFNAALVSFVNFGSRIPRKASVLTVTHEFGHSFGASHDPNTKECSPGGRAGNYVMYTRASDGTQPNNFLFSPCSKREMSPIIALKGSQCFIAHNNGSYCGNKIVEEGEDCDCGRPAECHEVDKCCVARDDSNNIPGCTIKPGKHCSSVAGTCCTNECTLILESQALVCQEETACSLSATCKNGRCPLAESKPQNVTCNNGANTCLGGECIGSICALYGFSECECHVTPQLCHVCCNNSQAVCTSTEHLLGRVILRHPGSTCKQHRGYCDSSGQCVTVDDEDQLNKLKETFKKLFSKSAMKTFWAWVKAQWYYVVAIFVGFCLMLVLVKVTYTRRASLLKLARRTVLPHTLRHHRGQMPYLGPRTMERYRLQRIVEEMTEMGMINEDSALKQKREADGLQCRLKLQFPDASSRAVWSAVRHSASEQSAIDRLLAQGYTWNKNADQSIENQLKSVRPGKNGNVKAI